ncbi:hypothetical protein LQ318_05335 [Aliifodinibius salicampi]|uniref:Uncharacterized protein n=1 Tax=Fodinibius salicampi TaxID=1920655 RepID=A0ABT3PWU7_9BACT|nr:hypothetical protein [Fodinibius salicampi]MCW9712325.1 hypothetical protein [Fodinibius salicampi]
MQTLIQEKINVNAIYRGFKDDDESMGRDWTHKRIEPLSFKRANKKIFEIAQIRKSYAARKGDTLHVHFVVRTTEDRFFEMVYDSGKITWILLYEFDDELLFN